MTAMATRPPAAARHGGAEVSEVITSEVDDFNIALPRMTGALFRSGPGEDATHLRLRDYGTVQVGHAHTGFPKMGYAEVDSGAILVAICMASPSGARWNATDLSAGDVLVYPAGTRHQAVNVPGMEVGFAVLDEGDVLEAIDDLGRRPSPVRQRALQRGPALGLVGAFSATAFSHDVDHLVSAVARVVSAPSALRAKASMRRLSSQDIVRRAVDYAVEADDWMPSSLVLCRAAAVSERRLQMAFRETYDATPSEYFKSRALAEARSRLMSRGMQHAPVSSVAVELGFHHLGRFAAAFHQQFGEYPSELARRTSGVSIAR